MGAIERMCMCAFMRNRAHLCTKLYFGLGPSMKKAIPKGKASLWNGEGEAEEGDGGALLKTN